MGHPDIITSNFKDVTEYFGIILCKVLPPRGLYLPVLPFRCNGKLLFPLCRTCAESMNQSPCNHTDSERTIIGTWVSEEIKLAIKKGYVVEEVIVFSFNFHQ